MRPDRAAMSCAGRLTSAGVACDVVAPTLIPRAAADRVKTAGTACAWRCRAGPS
jgi:hypothetical protein